MKRLLLIGFIISLATMLFGQQVIEGTVTDAKSGETLIGVTVLLKGTAEGTVTDLNGKYRLSSPLMKDSSVIVYSFVGYSPVEIIAGSQTRIDVKLASKEYNLDELVVIGYGSAKKRNVLGAVSTVKNEDLTRLPVADFTQALQGRVAGVQVTQNTGAPGEGVTVRIRGSGSINSSNDPLYIVDGIPTSNALNILPPGDIESMTILKDASAAAIYGSRANNGIVLITTKKGIKGKTKVTYSGQVGIQKVANLTKMVNTKDYITIYNEAATNDNAFLPEALQRRLITQEDAANFADVNYLKELFRPAPITSHALTFSGGNETTNYLISTTYFKQQGIIKSTDYSRGTVSINVNTEASKWLTIGLSMLAGISNNNVIGSSGDGAGGNGGSVIRYAFFRNPAIPVQFENGTYVDRPAEYFGSQIYDSFLGDGYNPIGMTAYNDNNQKRDSYLGKTYIIAKLTDKLKFTTNFGMDYSSSSSRRFSPTWGTFGRINGVNGLSISKVRSANWTENNLLNYDTKFGEDHTFSAMLGFEAVKDNAQYLDASDMNFPVQDENVIFLGNGLGIKTVSQGVQSSTLASFFGRVMYDYKQKYYISGTLRRDGTSRFIGNNKWGTFYSLSAGWEVKQEDFLKDVKWIENLKVRAGYGAVGNQNIKLYADVDNLSPNYNYPIGGTSNSGYVQTALGNPNLKWETSYQYNGGIDAELWKGALALSIDYYYKITGNMLVSAPNPPSTGYAEAAVINSNGSVLNNGIELEATYRHKKTDWSYSIGGNLTYQHNKVLKLDAPQRDGLIETGTYATLTAAGQPIGAFYLLEMDGIFQNETEILTSAIQGQSGSIHPGDVKFKDQNGDGVIDSKDRVYLGSAIPKLVMGINLSANFRQFDVTAFLQGTYGNKIYVQVNQDIEGYYRGFPVTQRYFNERWTGEGTSNTQPRASWTAKSNNALPSSRFLEDGSYLRLKNLQVGYTLSKTVLKMIGLTQARVYVSGSNLYTLTKYSGLDPEMTVSDNSKNEGDRANGIDWGTYPSSMTFMLGVDVTF
ncbi:MAG: TonB-dependent receptor [Bacteroidetes bacterium]|nr:TonB-dependent receptor [Bacteroidota bacterium]